MAFAYDPPEGYRNQTDFPTKPANETDFRNQMMTLLDQIAAYVNTNPDGVDVINNGDASVTLENTSMATNRYRKKTILNSANVLDDAWLFRSSRPSDGAFLDYTLSGPSGGIWTSGNNPSVLGINGYQRLQGGWVQQHGTTIVPASAAAFPVTLNIAFAAIYTVNYTTVSQAASNITLNDSISTTGFTVNNSTAVPTRIFWTSIGRI